MCVHGSVVGVGDGKGGEVGDDDGGAEGGGGESDGVGESGVFAYV